MTESTKEVFKNHEIRKTKEQRSAFRKYVCNLAESEGYAVRTDRVKSSVRNLIVGDPEGADVIFTAHYDTCAAMPFPNFITPRSIPIYILYQLFLTTIIYIIPIFFMFIIPPILLIETGSTSLSAICTLLGYVLFVLFTILIMIGPANKHTANDNTSGVTLLLDLMQDMPTELRNKAAFIFFDLEELGMLGSKAYRQMHRKISETKPIVNFDCVSDGKNIMFALKKGARYLEPMLSEAFKEDGNYSVTVASKRVFYPSDQMNFKLGVGVAALKKNKLGILYMNRIHTKRDTVYDEENIEFLKNGAIHLTSILSKNEA